MKIVECVPNFSEGCNVETIEAIRRAAESVPGITVLDCENDQDHNRMVLTFVGSPEGVKEAALASSAVAIRLIDLRVHKGEHPRIGAVDVVPFVPLRETTMDDCVKIANEFGREYSNRFGIPVFLYEAAATRPERKDLAKVREGQFEGLRELIGRDPSRDPDYGPRVIHPSAGATAVGARPVLIAYNINLSTTDISIARKIAHLVRGRDGGLPTVKALGFELKDRSMVQVSMNLTNYKVSSIKDAFESVSRHAADLGVSVLESEIVGLVPLDALIEFSVSYLRLHNFASDQIIENKLFKISEGTGKTQSLDPALDEDFSKFTLAQFASAVSSSRPTPGGGTVSAYSGALAASLVAMVCRLTMGKKGYESRAERIGFILQRVEISRERLLQLANADSAAYSKVSKALALPKNNDDERSLRKHELTNALREATEVPAKVISECSKLLPLAREVLDIGNKNAVSDTETAIELAKAAAKGAWSNVKVNLDGLGHDTQYVEKVYSSLQETIEKLGLT